MTALDGSEIKPLLDAMEAKGRTCAMMIIVAREEGGDVRSVDDLEVLKVLTPNMDREQAEKWMRLGVEDWTPLS